MCGVDPLLGSAILPSLELKAAASISLLEIIIAKVTPKDPGLTALPCLWGKHNQLASSFHRAERRVQEAKQGNSLQL